jgi:hypothetical protein
MRKRTVVVFGIALALATAADACAPDSEEGGPVDGRTDATDGGGDVADDVGADDGWAEYEAVGDHGTDGDGGTLILPDCSGCPAVGTELDNLRCAIDLCDPSVFIEQTYWSPTITKEAKLTRSRAAIERFGDSGNDLEPLLNGSYAVMATGYAVPAVPPDNYDHNQSLGATLVKPDGPSVPDPHASSDESPAYDVVEWSLRLRAPADAHGFQIHYVFFSEEYDEYVGREFNDKFYIFLVAASTASFEHPIINFTQCRPSVTTPDFTCPADWPGCTEGDELCYLAVNSALSECCWYDGCTTMDENTDISGAGFECGMAEQDYVGDYSMGFTYGSSTGWLVTEWPIEPNEEFTVVFHVHDTADSLLDSEILLDKFVFKTDSDAGTTILL